MGVGLVVSWMDENDCNIDPLTEQLVFRIVGAGVIYSNGVFSCPLLG